MIAFAENNLVLAYSTNSRGADSIAGPDAPFNPPGSAPTAAADWYDQVTQPGVPIGSTNPFLDPTGCRIDMVFQLAALRYSMPALHDTLLQHYTLTRPTDVLGTSYDYQILHESSAYAASQANPSTYRYVRLPPAVSLRDSSQNRRYAQVFTVVPGLGLLNSASEVAIPAARAVWGVTILNAAPHPAAAVQLLQLLFSPRGTALQAADGLTLISPPISQRRRLQPATPRVAAAGEPGIAPRLIPTRSCRAACS